MKIKHLQDTYWKVKQLLKVVADADSQIGNELRANIQMSEIEEMFTFIQSAEDLGIHRLKRYVN